MQLGKKKQQQKLARETVECLEILSSLLKSYEAGDKNLYKPMASQLRILLCDTHGKKDHSLIGRLFPQIKLLAFHEIQSLHPPNSPLGMYSNPFEITSRSNGVIVAEFDLSDPPHYIGLSEWKQQVVTWLPRKLTVFQIIRAVCDKGGGAHVDDDDGPDLGAMKRSGPTEGGIHIPFIIAATRYALRIGAAIMEKYGKSWGVERWNFVPPAQPVGYWTWEVGPVEVNKSET